MSKGSSPTKDYDVYVTTVGNEIHIYSPPTEVIASITPGTRPKRPRIEMKTVLQGKGNKEAYGQKRWAKAGDEVYDLEYEPAKKEWQEQREALQTAARLVCALRDVKYPGALVFPVHVQELVDLGMIELPEHPYLLKELWLNSTLLESSADQRGVEFAIQRREGIPEEVIKQMEDSFQDFLLGRVTTGMAPDTSESGGSSLADDGDESVRAPSDGSTKS